MSSSKVRENKTCLNCGSFVRDSYCSKCGQKNVESRQSALHLFNHFIADLVHYDNSFWRTTKYLLFFPAKLSNEYMKGKRASYVNPFSLYIFVSFIAFLIPSQYSFFQLDFLDKLNQDKPLEVYLNNVGITKDGTSEYSYDEVLDKIEKYKDKTLSIQKFRDSFYTALPKVMFIYLPIFAFMMWLFFRNKRKYYFDSGIFTLHFFSTVLIAYILISFISYPLFIAFESKHNVIEKFFTKTFLLYITIVYFTAIYLFYRDKIVTTLFKTLTLMLLNAFLMFMVFIILILSVALISFPNLISI